MSKVNLENMALTELVIRSMAKGIPCKGKDAETLREKLAPKKQSPVRGVGDCSPHNQGGNTMPLAVDNLTKDSSIVAIREAIGKSIATCIREGERDQKQCAGMVYGIAREKTGKALGEGKQR